MKFVSTTFAAAAATMAVSFAAYSETPFEATSEEQSKYDDKCFHCIDEGNLFCGTVGQK